MGVDRDKPSGLPDSFSIPPCQWTCRVGRTSLSLSLSSAPWLMQVHTRERRSSQRCGAAVRQIGSGDPITAPWWESRASTRVQVYRGNWVIPERYLQLFLASLTRSERETVRGGKDGKFAHGVARGERWRFHFRDIWISLADVYSANFAETNLASRFHRLRLITALRSTLNEHLFSSYK